METTKSSAWIRRLRQALGRTGDVDGEDPEEAGFTLIELMVVLLIMGILLAIAIPTFLSVTGSAKKTAAQSNLTDAVTSAQSIYTNTQSFPVTSTGTVTQTALATAMHKTQTTITFITGSIPAATAGKNVISVYESSPQIVIMAALDGKTVCWAVAVNASSSSDQSMNPGDNYFGEAKPTSGCSAKSFTTLGGGSPPAWGKSFKTFKLT